MTFFAYLCNIAFLIFIIALHVDERPSQLGEILTFLPFVLLPVVNIVALREKRGKLSRRLYK